ncbi:MAG TPA: hypothetical protein VEW67_11720, partial [Thermoleophilaceae bacterium]|nr:hypothetical protein [Thermoleophilaceae bacterium]
TALRLFKPGVVSFGPVGWGRVDEGAWQPLPLGFSGPGRGGPFVITAEEQPELVELVELVLDSRPAGRIAWALSRFEMGCGRRRESEALSDYLLGLRALLERGADLASASLALRVAVLCAEEGERRGVQRRVELSQALERFVMGDSPDDDYMDAIGSDSPRTLVDEVERHLRALLRDVLCGYLDPDLRSLSDDLLLEQPHAAPAPEPASQPATAAAATEIESIESAGGEIGVTAVEPPLVDGEQLDWDDAGYSAPV